MSRHTRRCIHCDIPGCAAFYESSAKDWLVVQARARLAGWKQTGNRHRCPQHRNTPYTGPKSGRPL